MSLAVAIWESPTRYALAADTRVVRHVGAPAEQGRKTFRHGPCFAAWAGSMMAGQRFEAAFTLAPGDDPEAALRAAWEAVAAVAPQPHPDHWRNADVDVLLVGPAGVVRISAHGAVVWAPPMGGVAVGIVGCADEYALGWLDAKGRVGVEMAEAVILAACARYPGVGAPVDVLRSAPPRPACPCTEYAAKWWCQHVERAPSPKQCRVTSALGRCQRDVHEDLDEAHVWPPPDRIRTNACPPHPQHGPCVLLPPHLGMTCVYGTGPRVPTSPP